MLSKTRKCGKASADAGACNPILKGTSALAGAGGRLRALLPGDACGLFGGATGACRLHADGAGAALGAGREGAHEERERDLRAPTASAWLGVGQAVAVLPALCTIIM